MPFGAPHAWNHSLPIIAFLADAVNYKDCFDNYLKEGEQNEKLLEGDHNYYARKAAIESKI